MKIPIYIVNFNTTDLTNKCIKTIIDNVHCIDYEIIVFDNSDKIKFTSPYDVKIIDNTNGQYIYFDKVVKENSSLRLYCMFWNLDQAKHGSLKHAYTIQYLLDHEKDNFIILDSDTEVLHDFDFIEDGYLTIASICRKTFVPRFVPFIQYFNISLIKEKNIKYFDKYRILFGSNLQTYFLFDTGCSLYFDITNNKLPYKEIDYMKYVKHLGGGSWITNEKYREFFTKASY